MPEEVLYTINLVQKDDKLNLYYRVMLENANGVEMINYRVDTENYNHAFLLARGYFFELKKLHFNNSIASYIEQPYAGAGQGAIYQIDNFPSEIEISSSEAFYAELVEECGIIMYDMKLNQIEASNFLADKYKLNPAQVNYFFNLIKGRLTKND